MANRKKFLKDWRYITEYSLKNGKTVVNEKENSNWKYSCEYDFRKYAFEFNLKFIKDIIEDEIFDKMINHYTKLLNNSKDMENHWFFDKDAMEFFETDKNSKNR